MGKSRVIKLIGNAARHPVVAARGAVEFRGTVGMTYGDDPESPRSRAYDSARELAHMVTGRRYEH